MTTTHPPLWLVTTRGHYPLGLFVTREAAEAYGAAWEHQNPSPEARWRLLELTPDSDSITEHPSRS